MSPQTVLAVVSAVILLTLCVSSLFLWRALRQPYWWQFSLVSGVGCMLYVMDFYTRPTGDKPNLAAAVIALVCLVTIINAIATQQKLRVQHHRWLLGGNLVIAGVGTVLVALAALTRVQFNAFIAVLYLSLLVVILVHRGVTSSTVPLSVALLVQPALTLSVAFGSLEPFWLRYANGMVLFLVCMCVLVDSMLRENHRMKKMVGKLDDATKQLHVTLDAMMMGSQKVAQAGQEVSSSAQELAIRTDQQTDHVRSVADVINAVADQVQQTTGNVVAVDEQCNRLKDHARHGDEVVNGAVSSIQLISQRSTEMNAAISMIEAIAFQTNILAINAAIEAARAGTAGRGFAVVAAEVRALSQRTTDSARQVKQLIERTTAQADDGVHRIQGVKESLAGIVNNVEDVAARTQQVASDAMAQSESLASVKQRLQELAELTDSNAQLVATSVMAADDMNASASELKEMVARSSSGAVAEEDDDGVSPVVAEETLSQPAPTKLSSGAGAADEVWFF